MSWIAFLNGGSTDGAARNAAAPRKGLSEVGLEERNVTVEYHWMEGEYHRVPAGAKEALGRRQSPSPFSAYPIIEEPSRESLPG